tara:strand:+ start:2789 stop:3202 length:414 start_codon:yes stop_codon:yes gene_type:complete
MRKEKMKNMVTSYSAGSIIDLMPEGMYEELIEDVVILTNNPTGERLQEFHGGIEFDITINNRTLHWKVIHNFNDFFDLELYPKDRFGKLNTNQGQSENDIGNGDLKNVFDTLWKDYIDFHMAKGQKDFLATLINEEE